MGNPGGKAALSRAQTVLSVPPALSEMLTRSFLQYPNQRLPSSPVSTKEKVSLGNQSRVGVKFTTQLRAVTDKAHRLLLVVLTRAKA